MGSFANSLHVQHTDASVVAAAIREILEGEGYDESDVPLDDVDYGSEDRGIRIAEAQAGWVTVLDSDMIGVMLLGQQLSQQLGTHALAVMVNDSDSWHYYLFENGRTLAQFNSDGSPEDVGQASLPSNLDGLDDDEQALLDSMPPEIAGIIEQLAPKLEAEQTPEILAIQDRMESGSASREDMAKYNAWMQDLMKSAAEMLSGSTEFGEMLMNSPATDEAQRQPPDEQQIRSHVERLRPLLRQEVSDEQAAAVLGRKDTFAEETLGDFLPLLGIPAVHASLSHKYYEEASPADWQRTGIRWLPEQWYMGPQA